MKNDNIKNQYRVNDQIRAREVRIVGDDIESIVMPLNKALALADEKELDLVEISPNANPPVCRLIEYSKFLYQLKKRAKEQKAKQEQKSAQKPDAPKADGEHAPKSHHHRRHYHHRRKPKSEGGASN